MLKLESNQENITFNRFAMQKIYGKEVLHDLLRCLVQKIRQLLISVEKQDNVEKNKMASKIAAKRTPWDNISQWEHQNSYIDKLQKYIFRVVGDPPSCSTIINKVIKHRYRYIGLLPF